MVPTSGWGYPQPFSGRHCSRDSKITPTQGWCNMRSGNDQPHPPVWTCTSVSLTAVWPLPQGCLRQQGCTRGTNGAESNYWFYSFSRYAPGGPVWRHFTVVVPPSQEELLQPGLYRKVFLKGHIPISKIQAWSMRDSKPAGARKGNN